ncbi:acyl-CoA thioesterase [Algicola sagamiensis]|uniref:acyl-CoA thioesterase n=1 Tax=Algicola sagamiensis TaxID=163869 RepID=UPI00037A3DEE|nr:thioesterase family protein [Algicola sagamiensis]
MFQEIIKPRFVETDALGHINNTVLPVWFEAARTPIFQILRPDLALEKWNMIVARIDVDFHGELHYGDDVELRTYIKRIGSSSFDVFQEAWQGGEKRASGTTVMVHFDHQNKCSVPLSDEHKATMQAHLYPA